MGESRSKELQQWSKRFRRYRMHLTFEGAVLCAWDRVCKCHCCGVHERKTCHARSIVRNSLSSRPNFFLAWWPDSSELKGASYLAIPRILPGRATAFSIAGAAPAGRMLPTGWWPLSSWHCSKASPTRMSASPHTGGIKSDGRTILLAKLFSLEAS